MSDYKELVRRLRADYADQPEAADAIEKLSAEVERWRDPESDERQKLQEEIIFSLGDGARSEVELREGQLDATEEALAHVRADLERVRAERNRFLTALASVTAEAQQLKQELAEARSSDAESVAMYHRARDRADALQVELTEARAEIDRIRAAASFVVENRDKITDAVDKADALDDLEAWLRENPLETADLVLEREDVFGPWLVRVSLGDGDVCVWKEGLAAAIRAAIEKARQA